MMQKLIDQLRCQNPHSTNECINLMGSAARALQNLMAENDEMRRTFGSNLLPVDIERLLIGQVLYYRVPTLDKRISRGDDFAGDAWVRYTAPGHRPDEDQQSAAELHAQLTDMQGEVNRLHNALQSAAGALELVYAHGAAAKARAALKGDA